MKSFLKPEAPHGSTWQPGGALPALLWHVHEVNSSVPAVSLTQCKEALNCGTQSPNFAPKQTFLFSMWIISSVV